MLKKILYGIGGIFILIIIIGNLAPEPELEIVQKVERRVPVSKPKDKVVENTVKTEEPKPVEVKTTQSVVVKSSAPSPTYTYYAVTDVIDGDTLKVSINGSIETLRLIGIDTPETVDPRKPVQCFGKEASSKAKELLISHKVRLEKDPTQGERDKYGRLLAYIYREDGLFYNQFMIEQGYAHEYIYNTPYKYQIEFKAAQKSAQNTQRGLWSPGTCSGGTSQGTISTQPAQSTSAGKYYTSSHYSAKYYYPANCDGWETLSPSYLKSFDSVEELLSAYPSRTKNPQCD